jgi:hypothetical protein
MEKALGGDLGMLKPPYTVWIAAAFFGLPVALSSAWMSSHFHASREASHVEKETAPKNAGNSSRPILVEIFSSDEDKARVEQHEREKANTDLDLAEATWAIAKVTGFLAIFTLAVAGFISCGCKPVTLPIRRARTAQGISRHSPISSAPMW